ncbi:hypothetical protein AXK11_01150 [Cephaloticoccus primus]|uniref:Uncharacterized protein n=1 Tax=Cephaloticoccus primus TaxID=1548207 RepID=A0A139SU22_9BACT|nr:hypothetical protein AXK11_01150 [Cephaloticoccus primus]
MLVWLIAAVIAGFVLQLVFSRWFGVNRTFTQLFALSPMGFKAGQVWPLLTYAFLHDPTNLLHIGGNLLGLYFLGRELLPVMGERRFLIFYGAATVMGGLLWLGTHWLGRDYSLLLGASASVYGLLTVYACFYPDRRITLLLFFIMPLSVKPKHLAFIALGLSACGFLFYEIMGAASPFGIAHSAHLGGMLTGWLYYRYLHERRWGTGRGGAVSLELPRWFKRRNKKAGLTTAARGASAPKYRVNMSNPADLRAEVDRILDKINTKGFGALTDEEKRLLDSAKDLLSRR